MPRIAVGGLNHETNSFAPQPATFERFEEADGWPPLSRGDAVLANTAGLNLAIAGFAAAAAPRHELVPLTWANACPSGPVTRDAFERLAGMLVDDLARAMPVDGLFLDLHGAMVAEHLEDGEGELLRRLREVAPRLPIVCALDLHANVSDEMVAHSDALVAFRTYPHVDLAATGARCLPLLERLLAGRPLAKALRTLDFLIPLPWQCSTIEPARSLYALAGALEAEGAAASASVCMGFPAADTPVCAPSVMAYADSQAGADAAADRLAAAFAASEPRFAGRLWTAGDAVARAIAGAGEGRTTILADTQDNPGGGGTADTTGLLAELVRRRATSAVLALLADGEAAALAVAAGEGATLRGCRSAAGTGRRGWSRWSPTGRSSGSATGGSRRRGRCTAAAGWTSGRWRCCGRRRRPASSSRSRPGGCRRPTGRSCATSAWNRRNAGSWRSRARSTSAPTSSRWRRRSWSSAPRAPASPIRPSCRSAGFPPGCAAVRPRAWRRSSIHGHRDGLPRPRGEGRPQLVLAVC
jgi:microcystin degradation protein MlrC